MIRHLRKAHGGQALYAGGGSIGIIGAARAGFVVGRDPSDETGARRILAATKCNLGPEPPSLAYRLVSDDDLAVARVEWEPDPVDVTAGQLLSAPDDDEERRDRDEAVEFLRDFLTDRGGEAARADVVKAARIAGISESTVKRARAKAGVTADRRGFKGGSVWVLDPPFGSHSVHSAQDTEPGPNGLNVTRMANPDEAGSPLVGAPTCPGDMGPCSRCRQPTVRYGAKGNPLCPECTTARPTGVEEGTP